MNYKKKKKLLKLKMDIINNFYNSRLFNEHLEIETIDCIIATLYSFNIAFPSVSEYLKKVDEKKYHKFNYIDKQRERILLAALELKQEIVKTTCNNDYFLKNSHKFKKYEIVYDSENDIEFIKNKFESILYLIKRLIKLLENYDIKRLEPFCMLIKRISNCYNVIYYSYYKRDKKTIEQNDNDNISKLIDEVIEDDYEENDWTINRELKLEDNIDIIDDIYIDISSYAENKNEYELLIGIIISDFYEYYKSDKNLYIDDKYDDILDLLEYIEENNLETIANQFKDNPIWGYFILDSYIYYNMNYSPHKRLENRQKIKDIGKLEVLKKLNVFINDTLVDETLYNVLMLSDVIRISNGNLFDELDRIDDIPTEDLLFKYFTSSFTPDMDNIIPIEIKGININTLKYLQLKFIISDIFSRELCNGNKTVDFLLDKKPDKLYNLITSNHNLLKKYLKQYIDEIYDYKELELNKTQKEKIIRFNKLVALDDI